MKKKLLFVMFLLIGACMIPGCSQTPKLAEEPTETTTEAEIIPEVMEIGQSYTVNDKANIIISKIQTVEYTSPLLGLGSTTYFKITGKIIVDVVLTIENLSNEEAAANELIKITAMDLETSTEYEPNKYEAEINNYNDLSTEEKIKPGEQGRVHCNLQVPENNHSYKIYIGEDKEFEIEYQSGTLAANYEILEKDVKIECENFSDITLKDVYYTPSIEPPNPTSIYNYAKAKEENNTLLVAKFEITNHTGEEKELQDLLNVSTYSASEDFLMVQFQAIAEKSDGSNLVISLSGLSSPTIGAEETLTVYYANEVNTTLQEEDVDLFIAMKGKEYIYTQNAASAAEDTAE